MACILNIETATEICSVTVSENGNLIFHKEETKGPSHAVLLGVFAKEAMEEIRLQKIRLDAVAVSCGPGSYTGLRIGVSEAKGLCYGLGIPLIAINTLKIMAHGVLKNQDVDQDTLLCPMIDARRMEVYDVLLNNKLEEIRPVSADIIDENSFADFLKENKVMFFGNGAAKCKDVLPKGNTIFLESIYPRALDMVELSEKAYAEKSFVDAAYFEPFYLKEFVATTPKNKVLGNI
ncbi:MAG: tRNA (adenosine(37)-N6)-threonylcarbamoyltransferase complex dimerization subunit type 1 TsaB [Dysgonomonas sp.]